MSSPNFVSFACSLADAAREVTVPAAVAMQDAEDKGGAGDFDPVTPADREAERVMRAIIEAHFPDHGIDGEEFPPREGGGRYCWSLDPIDGTRSFICGLPGWTTLIALLEDGVPLVGVIDAPAAGERYVGAGESGRLIGPGGTRSLKTSECAELAEARLATTDPYLFEGGNADAFERLRRSVRMTRFGFDAYAYGRLAAGGIDLVAETGLQPHDYRALLPVIRAAGGVIGNWRGGSDLDRGDILAAASQQLFDAAVETLEGA
jgi:histidinol phosphatase-like enzyme (inositol monophosphatase family)